MSELGFEYAPLRVFVVWHPSFAGGLALFRALYDWLGGHDRDLHRRGLGIPVHAWTSPNPEEPPPPPPRASQSLTIVVAIVDGELVGRWRWRHWIDGLTEPLDSHAGPVVLLPWAVHPAAAHLQRIGALQLLGSNECDERQLRRRVTEACVIRMRDPQSPSPLRIFLSYAHQGKGPEVAAEVRRALHTYGHLSVFLDEHDLQPGAAWRHQLSEELNRGAALFAVVTDAYASRAWCREELRRFREPRRDVPNSNQWRLRQLFPSLTLTSFEELSRTPAPPLTPASPRPPVLLSVSDPSPEQLARPGFTKLHLDDFAVRLARMLLCEGFDVMYGGRPRDGFTESFQDDSGAVVTEARLINFVGWPFSRQLAAPQIADGFGITRYARVPWDGEASAREDDPWSLAQAATATRHTAVHRSLRDLEDQPIPRPAALIALGGQLNGFAGFLPGVAEEIAMALEAGIPVYVIGGLGGAAGASAKLLLNRTAPELTLRAFSSSPQYQRLHKTATDRRQTPELRRRLHWLRAVLRKARHAGPANGLSSEDNVELLTTLDLGRALALVSKGLRTAAASGHPVSQRQP